jgi:hypothetical protein
MPNEDTPKEIAHAPKYAYLHYTVYKEIGQDVV